ncbi:MAG TPA: Hsp20/alpha crystallin family protein [Xanthobacteraceae bacterium]|jgi:HSP20 family protein
MNLRSLIPLGREHSLTRLADPLISFQREIDRLFDEFTREWPGLGRTQELTPRMDVAETENEVELTAELPGLEEKDVEVKVVDNVLTITGEKKAEREEKEKNYRMFERSYGSFSRRLELPSGVNPDDIKASLANGVLKVTIPKPAPAQVKKVEVKSVPVSGKEKRSAGDAAERASHLK